MSTIDPQIAARQAIAILAPDLREGVDFSLDGSGAITWIHNADPRVTSSAISDAISRLTRVNPRRIFDEAQTIILAQQPAGLRAGLLDMSASVKVALMAGDIDAAKAFISAATNPPGSTLTSVQFASLQSQLLSLFP